MSTGSILTFRSTVTTKNQPTMKHTACKTQKSQPNTISDQVLVMTGATLSAQDINTLLEWLLTAMQAKNLINPTQKAASSQQTGEIKWDQWCSGPKTLARVWPTKKATRTQAMQQGETGQNGNCQQLLTQQESLDQNQKQTQQEKQNKTNKKPIKHGEMKLGWNLPISFESSYKTQGELLLRREDSSN